MNPSHASGPEVSTIGKYQLIANLGHGGMADVYLSVVHGPVGFNKLTVIKRLRPSLADEPEFLAMFLDEARLAARLNHPNVVQTNEVAEVDGIYYIAMEYLDGQPLNRILSRAVKAGPLPRELFLRIVADSLAGLHHAHELADYDGSPIGVVHRDASPHNIFVTYDGQTKVVDFGIAKAATRSAETRGGVLKGKIAYMAPEQARSDEVDRRADIFAMGLVMWELMTGTRLRTGSDIEMLERIARGDVPRLSSAWPECPAALDDIMARATATSKMNRYATANEMRQDIVAYLESTNARASSEEVGQLLVGMFDAKRAEMRSIIERQLSGLRRASTEDVSLRVIDARRLSSDSLELPRVTLTSSPSVPSGGAPLTSSISGLGGGTGTSASLSGSTATSTPTATLASAERPGRMRAPVAIILIGLAAAVTVLLLRKSGESPPAVAGTPTSSVSATVVTASAAATTSATAADSATPSTATIEVRLSAKPEQAKIFLDDTALDSNPYVGRFRRDDRPHTLRIEADGHTSLQRAVSFDSDVTVDAALERAASWKEKPAAATPDGLPRPNRPKKALDGDDPWQ